MSAGDGTWRSGVRANKGFYWKEVGLVTVVLGWFLVLLGFFFGGQSHGMWSGGVEESKTGKTGKRRRQERYKAGDSMCLSIFIPISTLLPAMLSPWVGSGWGDLTGEPGWAQAVQQLCPAPGHYGALLALDWWKVHSVSGTVYLPPGAVGPYWPKTAGRSIVPRWPP